MSILRRIVLIVFGLLFITIITIALLVPQALRAIATNVDGLATPVRLIIVIVIDIVILALIYSLIRHRRVVNKGGLVVKSSGGNVLADVSADSARERILKVIRDVPAVVSAEARLDAIDGKADIEMDVVVEGDQINVPDKHKEIDRALRQVVVKQLGLQLASRPRVHIRLLGPDEALPVTEPAPVLPLAESPLRPPAPVAPPMMPPAPAATPAVGVDETSVSDAEVSSQYGLIGRRTDQFKAVPVQPPELIVEAAPVVEPPVVSPEPEFLAPWHEELTPPDEAAPVVEPEPTDSGFLRHWRAETPVTSSVVDPGGPSAAVEDQASDDQPVKVATAETDPIGQELESLDEAADSVEDRGGVRVYTMAEPEASDATMILPSAAPSESSAASDDDSTAAPSTVLYDDTGDSESEPDDADTRSKFP